MQLCDLGHLDRAVLLFGGPYSNVDAVTALIDRAKGLGIDPSHMISTGDTVAYCAAPNETCALIRSLGIPTVAGNCEQQLAAGAVDCGCGFETGTACDLLSVGWFGFASSVIQDDHKTWMASCPDLITFTHCGKRVAVLHGGLSDVSKFIWSTSPTETFMTEIDLIRDAVGDVDIVISGHSGIAFERYVNGVHWINAGVIGMPQNDGRQTTQFAVLDQAQLRFHELSYDAAQAASRMQKHGLTQGYHQSLLTGYWPSEDVLPRDLRGRAKG